MAWLGQRADALGGLAVLHPRLHGRGGGDHDYPLLGERVFFSVAVSWCPRNQWIFL